LAVYSLFVDAKNKKNYFYAQNIGTGPARWETTNKKPKQTEKNEGKHRYPINESVYSAFNPAPYEYNF